MIIDSKIKPERIIIIEFPSEENIHIWLKSPEYSFNCGKTFGFLQKYIMSSETTKRKVS